MERGNWARIYMSVYGTRALLFREGRLRVVKCLRALFRAVNFHIGIPGVEKKVVDDARANNFGECLSPQPARVFSASAVLLILIVPSITIQLLLPWYVYRELFIKLKGNVSKTASHSLSCNRDSRTEK